MGDLKPWTKPDDSSTYTADLAAKQSSAARGKANGYAALDGAGKVPASQVPFGGIIKHFAGSDFVLSDAAAPADPATLTVIGNLAVASIGITFDANVPTGAGAPFSIGRLKPGFYPRTLLEVDAHMWNEDYVSPGAAVCYVSPASQGADAGRITLIPGVAMAQLRYVVLNFTYRLADPLVEDFAGGAGQEFVSARWQYELGRGPEGLEDSGWGNGEAQYAVDSNALTDGAGVLALTLRRESPPDNAAAPRNFTAPRMSTVDRFVPPVRIECRMKVPSQPGTYVGMWLYGDAPGAPTWPECGEIDIMEYVPAFLPEHIVQGTHNAPLAPDPENPYADFADTEFVDLDEVVSGDWHVFALEWRADSLTWFVDGEQTRHVTRDEYLASGRAWAWGDGCWPHRLIFNFATGFFFSGNVGAGFTHADWLLDWVRITSLVS